jgi:hypothetical protein
MSTDRENKNIGSDFDDFLKDEGILEEVSEAAEKRVQADKEMRAIVGAVDEKWHERGFRGDFEYCLICDSRAIVDFPWPDCGFDARADHTNPSPTDVTVLLGYAKKLGLEFTLSYSPYLDDNKYCADIIKEGIADICVTADTPGDALRSALYQAVEQMKGEG